MIVVCPYCGFEKIDFAGRNPSHHPWCKEIPAKHRQPHPDRALVAQIAATLYEAGGGSVEACANKAVTRARAILAEVDRV